jgi:hypothetical protein
MDCQWREYDGVHGLLPECGVHAVAMMRVKFKSGQIRNLHVCEEHFSRLPDRLGPLRVLERWGREAPPRHGG